MKKLIAVTIAFATVPAIANAEPISLAIGNAIFQGAYSIGIAGGVANFLANSVGVIALAGAKVGASSFSRAAL